MANVRKVKQSTNVQSSMCVGVRMSILWVMRPEIISLHIAGNIWTYNIYYKYVWVCLCVCLKCERSCVSVCMTPLLSRICGSNGREVVCAMVRSFTRVLIANLFNHISRRDESCVCVCVSVQWRRGGDNHMNDNCHRLFFGVRRRNGVWIHNPFRLSRKSTRILGETIAGEFRCGEFISK